MNANSTFIKPIFIRYFLKSKDVKTITNQELIKFMIENNVTLERCIDTIIEVNGIIGVGLITLGDHLKNYCYHHSEIKREGH